MTYYAQWEADWLLGIQEHLRNDFLTPILKFLSTLADKGAIWAIIAFILFVIPLAVLFFAELSDEKRKTFREIFTVGLMSGIAFVLIVIIDFVILKQAVGRIRPYELIEGLTLLVDPSDDPSFPSAHAASSFAVATVLLFRLPKKFGIPAIILAAIISFSRLYVGIHFPTDVIFGAISGFAVGCISIVIGNYLMRKLKAKQFPDFLWN